MFYGRQTSHLIWSKINSIIIFFSDFSSFVLTGAHLTITTKMIFKILCNTLVFMGKTILLVKNMCCNVKIYVSWYPLLLSFVCHLIFHNDVSCDVCYHRAQEALKTGHFVSVLQVLMQLQRVCNHPELVAPRENSSSYFSSSLQYNVPMLVLEALKNDSSKVYTCALHCNPVFTGPV